LFFKLFSVFDTLRLAPESKTISHKIFLSKTKRNWSTNTNHELTVVPVDRRHVNDRFTLHLVSEKNWTLCYFIISLLLHLRIA